MTRYDVQHEDQVVAKLRHDVQDMIRGRVARRIAELGTVYTAGQIRDGDFLDQVAKYQRVAEEWTRNGGR